MPVKRADLYRAIDRENARAVEAENLLAQAREHLTEGILREDALARRVHLLEQKLREAGVPVP